MGDIQKTARYGGINYVDIDGNVQLPVDFETDILPSKGDVMCFAHLVGNDSAYLHGEVLYIYNKFLTYGEKQMIDCPIRSVGVYVVLKMLDPELGNATWKNIYELIKK